MGKSVLIKQEIHSLAKKKAKEEGMLLSAWIEKAIILKGEKND